MALNLFIIEQKPDDFAMRLRYKDELRDTNVKKQQNTTISQIIFCSAKKRHIHSTPSRGGVRMGTC